MRQHLCKKLALAILAGMGGNAVAAGLPPLQVPPSLLDSRGNTGRRAVPPAPPATAPDGTVKTAKEPTTGDTATETPLPASAIGQKTAPATDPATAAPTAITTEAKPATTGDAGPERAAMKSTVAEEAAAATSTSTLAAGRNQPATIRADRIQGRDQVETVAEGHAVLERDGNTLTADRLTYWPLDDEMEAEGNVELRQEQDWIAGPKLRMKIEDRIGYFEQPRYTLRRQPPTGGSTLRAPVAGSGKAERIDFAGEGVYRLTRGTYSTCAAPDPDWYAKAQKLNLDYNAEIGEARNATVYFKDVPFLYAPWLNFSLNNQRKSGFLSPTYGTTSNSGIEVTLPFYWNIAPNMDATLSPRAMARRGLQLNTEFRYLEPNYSGMSRVEYLPRDQLTGTSRSAYSFQHQHNLGHGFSGNINVNGASDDTYFTDLSSRLSVVTQTNLLRQGSLSYGGGWWNATLMAQRYQTLQDPAAPVGVPYYRLPQFLVTAARPDLPAGLAFNFTGEFVNFSHPTQVEGKRTLLYPQLALPLQTAAFFATPKLGLHLTRYSLERTDPGNPVQINRRLPIASFDSGVILERNIEWFGRAQTQTLEPRLYYLYVPSRDQAKIPVFDSALADFNFAQIFSENRYGGNDRIGDANQLTAALISRLIDPETGAERIRAAIGQRYYFSGQSVTLPGEAPRNDRKTDILAAFAGQVFAHAYLDAGWQYSPSYQRTERLNLSARYQPEIGKVINAGYRYTRDQFGQVDISGQWPLLGGWHGVGRYNYSTKDRRLIESLGGLEYDGGCWVLRLVAHRLATQTQKTSSAFFVQLELNGFARIGSNPLDMLKRSIPGYGVINQPTADPIFGAQ